MAEFQEVVKQAQRMCEEIGDCHCCPLHDLVEELVDCPLFAGKLDAKTIEETVTKWAAEHPEPRYPTWKEWQDTNFPNNDALMRPCIFESEEYFGCSKLETGCGKCMNKPIPAEIAEKLGIKPIGGDADA